MKGTSGNRTAREGTARDRVAGAESMTTTIA
jgi:hypothetical protein